MMHGSLKKMSNSPNLKETRWLSALTMLTSQGKVRWTLIVPPTGLKAQNYYEAPYGDKKLTLSERVSTSVRLTDLMIPKVPKFGSLSLAVIDRTTGSESMRLEGTKLEDLYSTVRSRAGDTDSLLDHLLDTAKNL
jgi:hypothetical protein